MLFKFRLTGHFKSKLPTWQTFFFLILGLLFHPHHYFHILRNLCHTSSTSPFISHSHLSPLGMPVPRLPVVLPPALQAGCVWLYFVVLSASLDLKEGYTAPSPARDFLDVLLYTFTHTHTMQNKDSSARSSLPVQAVFTCTHKSRLLGETRLGQEIREQVTTDCSSSGTLKSSLCTAGQMSSGYVFDIF